MEPENTPITPITPQNIPVQIVPPNKKSKKPIIFGVIILMGVVGGLGFLGGKYFPNSKISETVQTVTSSTPTLNPTPTINPTADWETLEINKLNFRIPNGWWNSSLQEENNKIDYSWININPIILPTPGDAVPGFAIYFEKNKTPLQIKEAFIKKWGMTEVVVSNQQPTAGSILIIEGNTQPGFLESKRFQVGIIANGNDSYYLVDLTLIENHKQIFNQILSTFKFTDNKVLGEKIVCASPRPEACTMECVAQPSYVCGSNGKFYCNKCVACSDSKVEWYIIKDEPCEN